MLESMRNRRVTIKWCRIELWGGVLIFKFFIKIFHSIYKRLTPPFCSSMLSVASAISKTYCKARWKSFATTAMWEIAPFMPWTSWPLRPPKPHHTKLSRITPVRNANKNGKHLLHRSAPCNYTHTQHVTLLSTRTTPNTWHFFPLQYDHLVHRINRIVD